MSVNPYVVVAEHYWLVDKTQTPDGLCPGGCECRLGTDDADRMDCACDNICCMVQQEDR